ncbi:MAG: hypothetical protein HOP29_13295 [Phycisphaerales bacterium]|nr:hypothetical protein [Phycisphaerales bacterium]
MLTVLAYLLVVPLGQCCFHIGGLIAGWLVALAFLWAPVALRTMLAGTVGGVGGVASSVAIGYTAFSLLCGPGSFTVGPFVVSTLPLLFPIFIGYQQWRAVVAARKQLLAAFASPNDLHTQLLKDELADMSHGSSVIGEILGMVSAAAWFLGRS